MTNKSTFDHIYSYGFKPKDVENKLFHHMHAELADGNTEYKYKLSNLTEEQFTHRVTQLNW